ncbi:MAG: DinB family protein [Chitinophagales bacterium]|nr:DinB family protein [Chitinophagaceae bacterium]MCB9063772.1 DinB family protein [Chitinophagales bacterium]
MNFNQQIAKHFRNVHFGGNWTSVNLNDLLKDVTWQQATTKVSNINTIATLTYHVHYFVHEVLKVLNGGELEAHDKYSFDHPPINSQDDWDRFLERVFADAKEFADLVEQLPDDKFFEDFTDAKYGNYYGNIVGITEHTHYHLGQIAVIKKMLNNAA